MKEEGRRYFLKPLWIGFVVGLAVEFAYLVLIFNLWPFRLLGWPIVDDALLHQQSIVLPVVNWEIDAFTACLPSLTWPFGMMLITKVAFDEIAVSPQTGRILREALWCAGSLLSFFCLITFLLLVLK